jgi:hypothetical protein
MTELQSRAPDAPGYYVGIPNADYHAGPGVSKSQLDLVDKAPALLEWSRNAPRDDEARAAVDIGDALHALLLEPDRFAEEFIQEFQPPRGVIVTNDDAKAALDELGVAHTTKDTKATLLAKLLEADPDAPVLERVREKWELENRHRTILSPAEWRKLQLMAASVRAHPTARMLLDAPGDVESCIYWIDPTTGELCRCRMDKYARPAGRRFIVDLKMSADPSEFQWAIEDYRYFVQDAFYTEGHTQHFGEAPDGFIFIVVGNQRDAGRYPVRVFQLDAEDRAAGDLAWRGALDKFAQCKASGVFPGVEYVSRPERARKAAALVAAGN